MKTIIFLLGLMVLVGGCTQGTANTEKNYSAIDGNVNSITDNPYVESMNQGADIMKVENGDTIKVEYVGTLADTGEEFDKSEGRGPLDFVVGAGNMIKGFDMAVVGMALNEEKTIQLLPEDAYGEVTEEALQWIPKTQMPSDINVEIGTQLITSNGMPVKVVDLNADSVRIDFNHPLAGKTLQFWIKVVDIQKK
ncbi:MAG: peptidylprolyl isomerase [archaeon]|nr:peptidylprolyl isomerase [archaeon]